MNTYISFFDILGFKEFINSNDLAEIERNFEHLLRDSQVALSGQAYTRINEGMFVPDLSRQQINCLHISDSIVFWTNSDSIEDFREIMNVSYTFYWRSLQSTFLVRGCLTYGEISFKPTVITNTKNIAFYNSSLIGKGLIDAYLKAESLEYAGCLIDESVIKKLDEIEINRLLREGQVCLYKVPFKNRESYEHVFRPTRNNHNDTSFRNTAIAIKDLFSRPSKTTIGKLSDSVTVKLNNTIDFINYFRVTDNLPEIIFDMEDEDTNDDS